MKRKITLFFCLTFCISSFLFAQQGDCSLLRRTSPDLANATQENIDDMMLKIIDKVGDCMEIDEWDKQIFSPTVLKAHLVQLTNEYEQITYGILIDHLIEYTSTQSYQDGKNGFKNLIDYKDRTIQKSDSVLIAENLGKIGFRREKLDNLLKDIFSEDNQNKTYGQVLKNHIKNFERPQPATKKVEPVSDNEAITEEMLFGHFEKLHSINQLSEVKSDKSILLYFAELGTAESRKFEEEMLLDTDVRVLLDHYQGFVGFTDSEVQLKEGLKADFPNENLSTVADYMQALKDSYAPGLEAPLLIIVDKDLKLKGIYASGRDKEKLIHFLERFKS